MTIDAAGCQKNIAAQIVDGKGDYVLALKGNQGKLFADVSLLLGCHLRDEFADCPVSRYLEAEEGHGRVEERRYFDISELARAAGFIPTEDDIVCQLRCVIQETGSFPTIKELINLGRYDLVGQIQKTGGQNVYREKLGVEPLREPRST